MPYRAISSRRPAWLSGRCRSSIRVPYTCCQDSSITPASQPGAAAASASSAARSVSPQLQPVQLADRAQHAGGIGALPPPALTRPSPASRSSSAPSARQSGHRPPARTGTRSARWRQTPGPPAPGRARTSTSSGPGPPRQPAGPSGSPRTAARWPSSAGPGRSPAAPHAERGGKPRIGVHLAQLLADTHRQVPLRRHRAPPAVSSGTSGQGRGCIDMTTPSCGQARGESDAQKIMN